VQMRKPEPAYNYGVPENNNHTVRNGIIWACIIAVAGTGGYYGWKALPTDMMDALAGLGSGGGGTTMVSMSSGSSDNSGTRETSNMTDQGPRWPSPVVVHSGADPLNLPDVVAGADLPSGDTAIGEIIPFARNAQCTLRPPQAAEKVVNVRVQSPLLDAPVQAFSNAQLADRLIKNVEAVTQRNKAYNLDGRISGQLTSLDVFLTDSSAPLYVVLQNMGAGVIWNIHTGPDVTLAHVAIIGSGFSGLVSPPGNATFEALLVRDFVSSHEFGADDEVRECMIRPWRNPQPDWTGSIKASRGNMLYENQMYSYSKGYEAYNRWYTATLGVDASTNLVTARDAAHVLIGPKPAEPIEYNAMTGRDIHLMGTDHMFSGDTATRATVTEDIHNTLLIAAIGGPVDDLNPAPMERGTQ
jgi:hypothetical protein